MGRIDGEVGGREREPEKSGLLPRRRGAWLYGARMLRTALTAFAALVAIALAAPAAGALSLEDLAVQEEQQYAAGLVRVAMEMVGERHRSCKVSHLSEPVTFSDDVPSPRLLSLLSLLRRPPIAEDAVPDEQSVLRSVEALGIYRNWYRIGRAADGAEVYVITSRSTQAARPASRFCLRKRHAQLVRLLRDEDRRTGRLALRAEREAAREQRTLRADGSEQVYLYPRVRGRVGTGGWRVGIGDLERRGLLVPTTFTNGEKYLERTHVVGVFPDGVTRLELTYARRAVVWPYTPPNVYESELRLTVPVQDNLVSFWVEREGADAVYPSQVVWRAADGSVVRVVRAGG